MREKWLRLCLEIYRPQLYKKLCKISLRYVLPIRFFNVSLAPVFIRPAYYCCQGNLPLVHVQTSNWSPRLCPHFGMFKLLLRGQLCAKSQLWQPLLPNPVQLSRLFMYKSIHVLIFRKHTCSVAQSHPTLWHPMGCSLPGSSVHGIFPSRILAQVSISSSRGSSRPRDRTRVSCIFCIGRWILYHWAHLGSPPDYQTWSKILLTILTQNQFNLKVLKVAKKMSYFKSYSMNCRQFYGTFVGHQTKPGFSLPS